MEADDRRPGRDDAARILHGVLLRAVLAEVEGAGGRIVMLDGAALDPATIRAPPAGTQ